MEWFTSDTSAFLDSDTATFPLDSPALSPFPDEPWEAFLDQDHIRAAPAPSSASFSGMSSECCSPLTPNADTANLAWATHPFAEHILFPALEDLLLTPPALDDNNDALGVWDLHPASVSNTGKLLCASPEPFIYDGSTIADHLKGISPEHTSGSCQIGCIPDASISTMQIATKSGNQMPSPGDIGLSRTKATPRKAGALDDDPVRLEELLQNVTEDSELRYSIHPLYTVSPDTAGYYHCPFRTTTGCSHKPTNVKSTFDKTLDSHIKPFKCKVSGCDIVSFSSTACLLRHEREAHGYHGHGNKPFLCEYPPCERARAGSGFPRMYNLIDHMKRVHNHVVEKKPAAIPVALKAKANKVKKPRRKSSIDGMNSKRRSSISTSAASSRKSSLATAASRRDSAVGFDAACQSTGKNKARDAASTLECHEALPFQQWENDFDAIAQKLVDTLPMYDTTGYEPDLSFEHRICCLRP